MTIGILVKPDTHERGLYENLIKEFSDLGYVISLEKDIILKEPDVKFLYPESYKIPAGKKALIKYLCGKLSSICFFEIESCESIEKEIQKLNVIKGKKELRCGLRYKYNRTPITDKELKEKTGNYYTYMMENLFHVFDNTKQINYFKKMI